MNDYSSEVFPAVHVVDLEIGLEVVYQDEKHRNFVGKAKLYLRSKIVTKGWFLYISHF